MAAYPSVFGRQRVPLLVFTFFGGSALFMGFKWRAVQQRSEEAKRNSIRSENYYVAPGRSGGGI